MDDTKMLDWVQVNLLTLREALDETFVMGYIDQSGVRREIVGDNLRDCITKATQ